jgi:hypothetical protein
MFVGVSGISPEFTCRESTASCDKLSMKGKLIPLRLNELLGGAPLPNLWLVFFASRYNALMINRPDDLTQL